MKGWRHWQGLRRRRIARAAVDPSRAIPSAWSPADQRVYECHLRPERNRARGEVAMWAWVDLSRTLGIAIDENAVMRHFLRPAWRPWEQMPTRRSWEQAR